MGNLDLALDARKALMMQSERGGRLLLWTLLLLLTALMTWAYFASLEEVIRGSGKVIPSSQIQVVQNLEGGIVESIAVREGDTVDPGEVLLRIDDTRFDSSLQESRTRLLSLRAKSVRLQAEAEGLNELPSLPADLSAALPEATEEQEKLFVERQRKLVAAQRVLKEQVVQKRQSISELHSRRHRLARSLELALEELNVTRPLQAQGAVSEVEVLRLERQVNDLEGELEQVELAIPRAHAERVEVEQRMQEQVAAFRSEARTELNEVRAELKSLSAGNVALADRVERTSVRSPIRGVVKKLAINTVGGVVQPGMDLVEIVPIEDNLVVEVRVKPRDIAFLRPGLGATVKLTAYDFTIYGGLDAQVEHISADTFVDDQGAAYYLVRVRTADLSLVHGEQTLSIIPGMTAEVDILVGQKTVLEYLLKPVLRARANALREP